MKVYSIISTLDGLDVWYYETLDEAVKDWLEGLNAGRIATSFKELYKSNGAQAVLDMTKEMHYTDADYLWNEGEQRITEVDIPWAVSKKEHDERIQAFEEDLQDAIESKPTGEQQNVLDALEVGYGGNANHYIDCLRPALAYASEHYGYSSPEYTAIDTIINYIAK
jgi:hypothetical protein